MKRNGMLSPTVLFCKQILLLSSSQFIGCLAALTQLLYDLYNVNMILMHGVFILIILLINAILDTRV